MLKTFTKFVVYKKIHKIFNNKKNRSTKRYLMGYSFYEDAKAEANRIILEKRTSVTVKKSSDKFIKRTCTIKKERFSGLKELGQIANNEKCGNNYTKDHETLTKSRSLENTINVKKLDGRKVHKNCDRAGRTNSYSSQANNQCQRKLRHANRRLSRLEQAIDNELKILKEKQLSIIKMVAKSEINANDQKPSTFDLSQMNIISDENRTDYKAFGDHTCNLENTAFFKPGGRDESPTVVKDFITTPLVNGGYEQIVNICYGCFKPYRQCISSEACRPFARNPQRCSRGYESVPRPEYCYEGNYYLNPQTTPRGHTQNCTCKQGHNSNCCQCMEKELQISGSYKRRATDLKTQHFYYRKSVSRTSSKSPSPDKSKSAKHRTNSKLVQNKGNNTKSKEDYEEKGLNRKKETGVKVKNCEEHLKEKKVNKNDNKMGLFKKSEKSTSELSERFDNVLIEAIGLEKFFKLIETLGYVSEESSKPLNAHKKEAEKEHKTPVSEAETVKVTSKERVYEVYLRNPTTNSSTSPRDYSQDTSFGHSYKSGEYPSETLRMLKKMKFKEYKANTPTINRKVDHEINRPREEIEEKNSIHKSQDKTKIYYEYIKKYKNETEHDETEQEAHKTFAKDVSDTFQEQLNADGPASSERYYYCKEQDHVYKSKEHLKSKNDYKDGVEKMKHSKDIEHHFGTSRRIQELVGNKEKTSTPFSTEKSYRVYKENISNIEHKRQHYKNGTQSYSTGSNKGNVDESAKYKTKEHRQNVQGGGNNADNIANVFEKIRANPTDVIEQRYRIEKPLCDLYEMPRTSQGYKGNQESRNISKFLTDNSQHINNDAYYKNGIPSESSRQGYFRGSRRNENQVNNITTETSQYSNSNGNSADSRIHDVTEDINSGRSYVITPRARDPKNEYKEILNKLERNYFIDGTDPKAMSKPQSSFEEFKILERKTIPNKIRSNIEVRRDKDTKLKVCGENTKFNNEEPLSTSHSIHMEEAKEAMNHHFGFDNKECDRCYENHSPNKITKDKDFTVESNKLEDREGIDVLDPYSTCIRCSDGKSENKYHQGRIRNSSLDTLRCLTDLLNLYQKGTLEDENVKALAEELLTIISSNCSDSRVNCRASEDKSTLAHQEKRTIEVQCSNQAMFEGSKSGKSNITISELAKATKSSVMETPSSEKVVDRLKERADTTLKLDCGSSHQGATSDIKLKTTQQDLHTKIDDSNGSFQTFYQEDIARIDKCNEQEPRHLEAQHKTIQSKSAFQEVRSSPETKQQQITHRVDENSDKNRTPPQSYYPEVKSDCNQNLTKEAPAESKFDIPKSIISGDTDDVCEQSPPVTIEYKNVIQSEAQTVEDVVSEESLKTETITRKDFNITRDIPSGNAEYVYEQYPTTSKCINLKPTGYSEQQSESNDEYINFKPTEYLEPLSESHYEYFKFPEGSNFCEDRSLTHTTLETAQNRISDISKTRISPSDISAKVSNGAQDGFNNPSSSRLKYELACHPLYQTISTVKVGSEEQSLVQKSSYFIDKENIDNFRDKNGQTPLSQDEETNGRSTSYYTQRTIGNPTWYSNPSKLLQDKSTKHLCYPGEQIQQLHTAKRNLPIFQHCPCMLNTYVNLLKTYYKSNKRPIVSENLVNC